MEAKKQILASQIAMKRRLNNERLLERDLNRFFLRLKKEVLAALHEYWSEYQLMRGHVNLMCAPVHEAHREYYEILEKYVKREYKLGQAEAKRAVDRMNKWHKFAFKEVKTMPIAGFIKRDNDLFATSPKAERDLLNRTFRASERTMARVDNQINAIITDGYKSGKGINDIGNRLSKRFDQLATWESRRIARTEVNTSHNVATVDTYRDMGVEYTQWIAANDDRTRDTHAEVDGEIIPMGGKYSNGLEYPGDMSGPIEEWINCRCSNAPFVIPYGYLAPSFSPFREEDLVPIETRNLDELMQQANEELQSDLPYIQNIKDVLREATDTHEEYTDLVRSVEKFYKSTKDAPVEMIGVLDYNKQLYQNIGVENNVTIPYEAIYQGITDGIYFSGHNHPKNSTCFQSYADFENTVLCNEKYSYTVGKDGFFIIKNNNIDILTVEDLPYNVGDKYTATKMLVDTKKKRYEENGNPILETYNEVYNQIVDDFNKQYSKEIDEIHKNAVVHNKEFGVDEVDFAKIDREKKDLFDNHMHKNIEEYTHILNNKLSKYDVHVYYAPKR